MTMSTDTRAHGQNLKSMTSFASQSCAAADGAWRIFAGSAGKQADYVAGLVQRAAELGFPQADTDTWPKCLCREASMGT